MVFGRDEKSLGVHFWLAMWALLFETLLEIKFGWDIVSIPLPRTTVVAWSIFFAVVAGWSLWYFSYPVKKWPIFHQHLLKRTSQNKQKIS